MERLTDALRNLTPLTGGKRPQDVVLQSQESQANLLAAEVTSRKLACGFRDGAPTPKENFTWFNPSFQKAKGRLEARDMVDAFKRWTDGAGPPSLTVIGGAGIGKTELAKTAVWMLTPNSQDRHSYYLTAAEFDKRVKSFASVYGQAGGVSVDPDVWVERLAQVENLVLDDVAAGYIDRGWTASRLEALISLRDESNRRTVVITNLSRDALYQEVGDRVYSRITDAAKSVVIEPQHMADVRAIKERGE